jgi:hypothetical protein
MQQTSRMLGLVFISAALTMPFLAQAAKRAQPVTVCDRKVLVKTEHHLKQLKAADVERLFMTFDGNCTHHDDFHAWGNEMLFRVLQLKPKLFIQHLETIPNGKRRAILDELEHPLHNGFDISGIIHKVKHIKGHDRTKEALLDALKVAQRNN